MFFCERCGNGDCCERTDLVSEPVLCDDCYAIEVYGECNCDACQNGYYEGDKMRCKVDVCKPLYII